MPASYIKVWTPCCKESSLRYPLDEIYIFGSEDRHRKRDRSVMAWSVSNGLERSLVGMFFEGDSFGTALLSGRIWNVKNKVLFGMAVCGGVCNGQPLCSAGILYPERRQ